MKYGGDHCMFIFRSLCQSYENNSCLRNYYLGWTRISLLLQRHQHFRLLWQSADNRPKQNVALLRVRGL